MIVESVVTGEAIALAQREKGLLEAVVLEYSRLVYRIAFSVMRRPEEAEDATQETLLRVLRYGKKLADVEDRKACRMNKLRSGARYPVSTQNEQKITQIQYLDIGVNIDCRLEEQDGVVSLYATIDSSSASWPSPDTAHTPAGQPVIIQMRSEVRSPLRPGTSTVISSMDDPASKRRFQVDVTATKSN